jgi:hypothetical protein
MPRTLLVKTADVLVAPWTMRDASFGAMKIYLPRLLGGAVSDDLQQSGSSRRARCAGRAPTPLKLCSLPVKPTTKAL